MIENKMLLKQNIRPRRDSNPQSSDPKSDALSIRPRGQTQQISVENLNTKESLIEKFK